MNLKQHHRFIIAFISLLLLLSFIQDTYGKYKSNASANTDITIAGWNILINNHDINNNSNFSNAIIPIFPGSTHIASDIIAPNSEGYFDIQINATSVDVSFTETITLSHGIDNTITDLVIVGYSLNGGAIINFNSDTKTITKDVLLADNRIHTYRIYVNWQDGTGETMTNADDTNAVKNGIASISVDVNFVQKPN